MADSYNKKELNKRKKKRKQDKAERKKQRKLDGDKPAEFMYLDENGNLTPIPPDPTKKKEVKLEEIRIKTPKKGELEEVDTEKKGMVKFYNEEKRYGFIREVGTDQDYFVHEENLTGPIKENDKVVFEVQIGPKGLIAVNVKPFTKKKPQPPKEKDIPKDDTGEEQKQ